MLQIILCLLFLPLSPSPQSETSRTIVESGSWSAGSTWDRGAAPGSSSRVLVPSGPDQVSTVTIAPSTEAESLLVRTGRARGSVGAIEVRGTLVVRQHRDTEFTNAGCVLIGGTRGHGTLSQCPGSSVDVERGLLIADTANSVGFHVIDNATLNVGRSIRIARQPGARGKLHLVGNSMVRTNALDFGMGMAELRIEADDSGAPMVEIKNRSRLSGALKVSVAGTNPPNELVLLSLAAGVESDGGFGDVMIQSSNGDHYEISYQGGDGNDVSIVRQPNPLSRYANWRVAMFGVADSTDGRPFADPDEDGVPNIGEYKLHRSPHTDEGSAGRSDATDGQVRIVYTERTDRPDADIVHLTRVPGSTWSRKGAISRVVAEEGVYRTVEVTTKEQGSELRLGFSPSRPKQPNIVFILVDDMGWADNEIHGAEFYTPTIRELSRHGVSFSHHYVQPLCTPTRVGLLTGRYPGRFGWQAARVGTNRQAIPFATPTLATVLSEAGYKTGLVGKWHLGSVAQQGPQHFGFQKSYGLLAGGVGAYDHRYLLSKQLFTDTWHRNGTLILGAESDEPYTPGAHVTDLLTDAAVDFVEQAGPQPFFLLLAYNAVHTPIAEEAKWFQTPDGRIQAIEHVGRRQLAAAAHHLDHGIGQVMAAIESIGQLDNTLIVFTSDNGGPIRTIKGGRYPAPDPEMQAGFSSNGELRGGKASVYEGGIRVPAFASWPAQLQTRVVQQPVHIVDWVPTLCSVAGASVSELDLDGISIVDSLRAEAKLPNRSLYFSSGENWEQMALRRRRWKIASHDHGDTWELFDLESDPFEQLDKSGSKPDVLERLLSHLQQHRARDLGEYLLSAWIDGPKVVSQGEVVELTIRFSEPVSDVFDLTRLEIEGGTLLSITGASKQFAVKIQPTTQQVRVKLHDGFAYRRTDQARRTTRTATAITTIVP